MINTLDQALFAQLPAIPVPRFSTMQSLSESGLRMLVAEDGLWLEVNSGWLHAVVPYAPIDGTLPRLPYGKVEGHLAFPGGKVPLDLIRRFLAEAHEANTIEHMALIAFDNVDNSWHYMTPEAISSSSNHFHYAAYPEMPEHWTIAVDLHSHGQDEAYFSSMDNSDDASQIKMSVVAGQCHRPQEEMSLTARLCVRGVFIDQTSELVAAMKEGMQHEND